MRTKTSFLICLLFLITLISISFCNDTNDTSINTASITTLLQAVSQNSFEDAKVLLERGTDLETRDVIGQTSLMIAVHNNNYKISKLLLENGANVNVMNSHNITPLFIARNRGYNEIVKLLKDYGANDDLLLSGVKKLIKNGEYELADLVLDNIKSASPNPKMMMKYFFKSLELNSSTRETHYNMGLYFQRIGEFEKAQQEFRQELKINPLHKEAKKELAIVIEYGVSIDTSIYSGASQKAVKETIVLHNSMFESLNNVWEVILKSCLNSDFSKLSWSQVSNATPTNFLNAS